MFNQPSPLQLIQDELLVKHGIRLFIKRDDLIHPQVSGNKWRKLKYNLQTAQEQQQTRLLTFGGAYSNHIAATAAAGKMFGFETFGVIRGELIKPLNPTLFLAQQQGMRLISVDRQAYRAEKAELAARLQLELGECYVIPEGGSNALAVKGCAEIVTEVREQLDGKLPDYFCVSCGTGGTAAGLVTGLARMSVLKVFPALKGDFIKDEINRLIWESVGKKYDNWQLISDYDFGGYTKWNHQLINFINDFYEKFRIPIDPIYTGKLFYGVWNEIKKGRFQNGSTIVVIHTGGLQGIAGFNQRFGELLRLNNVET
ncbi:MAG: 1-aminocyclopropane-1-carboxylate deaminase/D-cysteine desulfhydrase [Richelia sp. RM2_1_2]|nr:1-aminocyclopropane-1-carboxylate deaminase/D-cysteine desulfhydrase [Richelia sp. RM1_1_1]NJO27491.1 1-aminocyclopropane-1-carboxylate deaminase/D-cysteine desulfhydrase [Richelia sp. SL_2_1]NJO58008.1 1-aminocyclopropane-1-carboxylate deaminase/D-cysteine desulfhydrase [Richelia sp. RM2_1_2]